jgi:hypothetical protein
LAKAAAAPVPVTVAIASREDLPIYLSGLGVVQASFTVGIRPQVDGKLAIGRRSRDNGAAMRLGDGKSRS